MDNADLNFFFPEKLTRCTLYRITSSEPRFAGFTEEGDVAYYGLILQSRKDIMIERYLKLSAKDHLWEYQHGFGVTSADSALVIEGLLETGTDIEYLKKSIENLFSKFYSREDGAFTTVTGGRAQYWKGVSVETTAHVAYLAARISPDKFEKEIGRCVDYVRNMQYGDGSWHGKWFPSIMIPTYYAVRFLNNAARGSEETVLLAEEYVLGTQDENGSWSNSVIESSAALLTLKLLKSSEEARKKAERWLVSEKNEDGWRGEPVLYYWFEEDGERLFYSCHDRGQITTAWASLALQVSD